MTSVRVISQFCFEFGEIKAQNHVAAKAHQCNFLQKAVYANTLDATELWQDFEGKQWFEEKAFQNLE